MAYCSSKNLGSLRKAERAEYEEIRKYLSNHFPKSLPMYNLVNTEMVYNLHEIKHPRSIYVSAEPNKMEFIFADRCASTTVASGQAFQVYWQLGQLSKEKILQYLLSVPNFNWDMGFRISNQEIDMCLQIDEFVKQKLLVSSTMKVDLEDTMYYYLIPSEKKIIEQKLPDGYRFGTLCPKHVPFLLKNWPYSTNESVTEYEKYLDLLPSCAIYEASDLECKFPLSHTLLYHYGLIGMTFTLPEHRRKGLASAVTAKFSQHMRNNSILPSIDIESKNTNSIAMHEKMGFVRQTTTMWKDYSPVQV